MVEMHREPAGKAAAAEIEKLLQDCQDPFHDPALARKIQLLVTGIGFSSRIQLDQGLPYLPIEWLRGKKFEKVYQPLPEDHLFLSSGTTSADRSNSPFSKLGLALYRASALCSFRSVLRKCFGDRFKQVRGYSLVPGYIKDIGESSLSTMLTWFSEEFPLRFIDPKALTNLMSLEYDQPIWLFCTTAHLANIIDQDNSPKLHPKSFLFTTGGLKSLKIKRSLDEIEMQAAKKLGLSKDRLLSQYGMCELATPAWQLPGTGSLRFPSWVKVKVESDFLMLEERGEGLINIDDPLRIDFGHPLRCQDIIQLQAQSICIISRVPNAPLKGCSLNFRDLIIPDKPLSLGADKNILPLWPELKRDVKPQNPCQFQNLYGLLYSKRFYEAIADELQSGFLAKQTVSDLKAKFPSSATAFKEAVENSGAQNLDYLCVLPNTHSIAGIAPLAFLSAKAKSIHIKLPAKFCQKETPIGQLLSLLLSIGIPVNLVPKLERNHAQQLLSKIDFVFGFGCDATKAFFGQFQKPMNFYGGLITLTILEPKSPHFDLLLRKSLADVYCLNRLGCFSSRAIIFTSCPTSVQLKAANLIIAEYAKSIGTNTRPAAMVLSEMIELVEYKGKGYRIHCTESVRQVMELKNQTSLDFLANDLPKNQFILPLFRCDHFFSLCKRWQGTNLRLLTENGTDTSYLVDSERVHLEEIGNGNTTHWNGSHLNRPYFLHQP